MAFLPNDPVLSAKQTPRVVARRARFRALVKATVGLCLAFCMVAALAGLRPAATSPTDGDAPRSARAAMIETLSVSPRTKMPSRLVPTTAKPVHKARTAKRH